MPQPFISDRRIYLNSDRSKAVEATDPEAAFLLVCEGGTLDHETAEKYGLLGQPASSAETKTSAPAPEDKMVRGPKGQK
jgi:hypothetical protein